MLWVAAGLVFSCSIVCPSLLGLKAKRNSGGDFSFERAAQRGDVELLHLQERRCDALGAGGVAAAQHLDERIRHHLPGEPELVLEPAAGALAAAAGDELAPVVVDLRLIRAVDLER